MFIPFDLQLFIVKGSGDEPLLSSAMDRLQVMTVHHPIRKEYIILYLDDISIPKASFVRELKTIHKQGYVITCGYLNHTALQEVNYKPVLDEYLKNLLPSTLVKVPSSEEFHNFFDTTVELPLKKKRMTGKELHDHRYRCDSRNVKILYAVVNGGTYASVGEKYKITGSRVREIFNKILRILNYRLRDNKEALELLCLNIREIRERKEEFIKLLDENRKHLKHVYK